MSLLSKLFNNDKEKTGKGIRQQYEQWSTPTLWRNDEGVYIGDNGQAWMYRSLELNPIKWEDNSARLGIGRQLESLLSELGQLSKDPIGGIRALSNNREIHIQSITWQEILSSPEENPPALTDFQQDAYGVTVPKRALFLGIRLIPRMFGGDKKEKSGKSIYRSMEELIRRAIAEDIPEVELYKDDIQRLSRIFNRHDAKIPTAEEYAQLESWFNDGLGSDVLIEEQTDQLIVDGVTPLQISAVREFEQTQFSSPQDQWVMDTLSHPGDAPHVISIRAELEPSKTTRERARMSQRKIKANIDEEEASGDIDRPEDAESYQLAREMESYLSTERRPMLSSVSMLMAREVSDGSETYMDYLDTAYGIQMSTLEHRQILALDETLPTSNVRVNPFLQDLNVPMIANAGLQAFSALGDDRGCFVGFVDPDGSPLFLDPSASSRQNLPPAFGVFGDPGSGKSSPVGTPVMTSDGSLVTMGDLRPGDYVPGVNGQATRVETIHPQGTLKTYRVTLGDGRTLETSDQHLWHVQDTAAENPVWENLELGSFMDDLHTEEGTPKYLVPVPRPLDTAGRDLPSDPYLIGAAAVAGLESSNWAPTTSEDDAEAISEVVSTGVVPQEYLFGSFTQREALLQGIVDAAGELTAGGFIRVTALSPQLADQVIPLVRSLGGIPQLEDGPEGSTDVVLELPADVRPFHLVDMPEYTGGTALQYTLPIVSVEEIGDDEHVCITVDAEDRLYVSGDYVVTHNTFFAQNFATQCVLYGMPVFFINPKAADPLPGLVDYINENTPSSASTISIMKATEKPGAFDPFRFANEPEYAATVASQFIMSALSTPQEPLPRELRLSLTSGLKNGATGGAQCVWDALDFIVNDEHREKLRTLIDQQMDASPLFSLGVAKEPRGRLNMMKNHLTLVSFDREIGLPATNNAETYSVDEHIAIATVNLVTKAALEILIANEGGVLVLDEAWTFLKQTESLAVLNRLSREGRSLNIIPVFLTQRIKDVITNDLEGFMSRVLVLKLNEKEEAETAIRICGLEPTSARLAQLREAGPKPPKDGKPAVWAQGLFRDLQMRHAWVALGPTPEEAMQAWSTNPDDKKKFEEAKRRELEAEHRAAAEEATGRVESLEDLQEIVGLSPDDMAGDAPVFGNTDHTEPEDESEEPTVTPAFAAQKPAWEQTSESTSTAASSLEAEESEERATPAFNVQKPAWEQSASEPAPEGGELGEDAAAPAPAFNTPTPPWEKAAEEPAQQEDSEEPEAVTPKFNTPKPAWATPEPAARDEDGSTPAGNLFAKKA